MIKNKVLFRFYMVLELLLLPFYADAASILSLDEIKKLRDTQEIIDAYTDITQHYYNLGDIDSLKITTYNCIKWCEQNQKEQKKYQVWRQYIQRMTEKGMQEEAITETERLQKDAENQKSTYGIACGEMCVGYNHRVFGNNIKLCVEYYNRALNLFKKLGCYDDALVVYLNTTQIHLSTQQYADALNCLNGLETLINEIKEKKQEVEAGLLIRFYQFRVIATIANSGKAKALKYIQETDQYYFSHPSSSTKEAWFGYKILCARSLSEWDTVLLYLDSLQNYHQSIGACYPANQLFKAQCLESLGRLREACSAYSSYAHLNDSVRKAELDDKLSKYTVQFEVNKLQMDKLELNAKINQSKLTTAITIGTLIFILFLILTYYYIRTLAMNKKLDKAYQAAEKASRIKTSFIQNISHEIRTPLNSIVGFSGLIASSIKDSKENKEYVELIETNNAYLLDMISNMIAIADMDSQTEDRPRKEFNLDSCCQKCIHSIKENLNDAVELIYKPSTKFLRITAVESWVRQVLFILLSNAAKFTHQGKITISYEVEQEKQFIKFIVEDTGIGIDEKYKESIFERFYKIDSFTRGTGLGLPVARQIMDLVGGTIHLDTSYKTGAKFIVYWPMEDYTIGKE